MTCIYLYNGIGLNIITIIAVTILENDNEKVKIKILLLLNFIIDTADKINNIKEIKNAILGVSFIKLFLIK